MALRLPFSAGAFVVGHRESYYLIKAAGWAMQGNWVISVRRIINWFMDPRGLVCLSFFFFSFFFPFVYWDWEAAPFQIFFCIIFAPLGVYPIRVGDRAARLSIAVPLSFFASALHDPPRHVHPATGQLSVVLKSVEEVNGGAALFFSPAFLRLFLYFSYTFLILFLGFKREEKEKKRQEKEKKRQEKEKKSEEKTKKRQEK